jgi:hypothetical protein
MKIEKKSEKYVMYKQWQHYGEIFLDVVLHHQIGMLMYIVTEVLIYL